MHWRKQTMEQENCQKLFVSIPRAECINWREAQLASHTFLCNLYILECSQLWSASWMAFHMGMPFGKPASHCGTATWVEALPLLINVVTLWAGTCGRGLDWNCSGGGGPGDANGGTDWGEWHGMCNGGRPDGGGALGSIGGGDDKLTWACGWVMEPWFENEQGSSECDEVGFKGTLVAGVGSFRLILAGSPPFRPRPLGKPVLANAERFGTF